MDVADLAGDWAVHDHVLTLGRSYDPRSFSLRGRGRGYRAGGWLAVEGQFVAEVTEYSMDGTERTTPDWMAAAVRVEGDGTRAVLRGARGNVTARATRIGAAPPAPPAPAPMPVGLAPVEPDTLLGCWIAEGSRGSRAPVTPSVTFGADGRFRATDGANPHRGLWLCGSGGAFAGTGGETTLRGGADLIRVTLWPGLASRAGFDGEVLVLLDADGAEVGRLERDRGEPAVR